MKRFSSVKSIEVLSLKDCGMSRMWNRDASSVRRAQNPRYGQRNRQGAANALSYCPLRTLRVAEASEGRGDRGQEEAFYID